MTEPTVRLPVNFFNLHLVHGLKHFDKNNELLTLFLKLYFISAEKRQTRDRNYFSLGDALLTDEIIENVFDLKEFNGKEATDLLEKLGMIVREEKKIIAIPFWINEHDTSSPDYSYWRNAVLKRDNFTCQRCGTTSNLQAHHIIRWKDTSCEKHLRFDINNGITLCKDCHLKEHGGSWR